MNGWFLSDQGKFYSDFEININDTVDLCLRLIEAVHDLGCIHRKLAPYPSRLDRL